MFILKLLYKLRDMDSSPSQLVSSALIIFMIWGGAFKNESVSFLHKELTLLDINSSNPFITIFPFQARFFSNDFCQNCRKFEASLFVPLEFFSFMFLLFSSLSPLFSFLFCFFIFLSWMLLQFFILKIKKNS